jgi:hypothetical protein
MSAYECADPAGVAEGDGGQVQDDGAVALVEEAVEPGEQSVRAGGVEFAGDHERGGGRRRLGDRDNEHLAVVPGQPGSKRGPLTGFQVVESSTTGVLSQHSEGVRDARGVRVDVKGLAAEVLAEKIIHVLAAQPYHGAAETLAKAMAELPAIGMIPDDLVSAV